MTFLNISPLLTVLGLLGLAGLLYLLQQLRVKHQEVQVPTLLFWQAAVEDSPARVFREKFHQLWAYLLILAICSLIWIAIAEPELKGDASGDSHYVLVLDGSAVALQDDFERVKESLVDDVAKLPMEQRTVLWVGGETHTLLAPGEQPILLERRLEGRVPEAAPSTINHQLELLAMANRKDQSTVAIIYGNAAVSESVLDRVSPTVAVFRASHREIESGNRGIVSFGVGEPVSGAWDTVDVLLRVASDQNLDVVVEDLRFALDSSPLADIAISDAGNGMFMLRDLPAAGGFLEVSLADDDVLAVDNVAKLRLPNRPFIRIALSPSLDGVLKTALQADRAVVLNTDVVDIVIRRAGETFSEQALAAGATLLEFAPMAQQKQAFLFTYPEEEVADFTLMAAVNDLGLQYIDAAGLATVAQQPIEVTARAGQQWSLSIWDELLSEDFNFVQSRSFPIFMAAAVRWFSGAETLRPYIAAGESLPADAIQSSASFLDEEGGEITTLSASFTPTVAGLLQRKEAEHLWVSLLSEQVTMQADQEFQGASLGSPKITVMSLFSSSNLVTWIILLVIALAFLEWVLFRRGRIP